LKFVTDISKIREQLQVHLCGALLSRSIVIEFVCFIAT